MNSRKSSLIATYENEEKGAMVDLKIFQRHIAAHTRRLLVEPYSVYYFISKLLAIKIFSYDNIHQK